MCVCVCVCVCVSFCWSVLSVTNTFVGVAVSMKLSEQSESYHIVGHFRGGNFCEKLEEAPRIKFCGFNFCSAIFHRLT